jgi:ATP-dependent RNA helicase RhlE
MFSATMPADVEQITRRSMRDPVKIQVGRSVPVDRAAQEIFHVSEEGKVELLRALLRKEKGRVLIFVRTKRGVDRLAPRLGRSSGPIARLHGDREQIDRDEAMGGFREGRYRILIATDIAARGIDVADIEHVINFDFPRSADDYVHRIGRTARLAAKGRATSFVTGADRRGLAEVEKLIGSKIPSTRAAGMPEPGAEEAPRGHAHGGGRQRRGRGGHAGSGAPHGHPPHGHREAAHTPQGHKEATPATGAPHGPHKEGHPTAPAAGQETGAPGQRRRRHRRGGKGRGPQGPAGEKPAAGHAPHPHAGPEPHTPSA